MTNFQTEISCQKRLLLFLPHFPNLFNDLPVPVSEKVSFTLIFINRNNLFTQMEIIVMQLIKIFINASNSATKYLHSSIRKSVTTYVQARLPLGGYIHEAALQGEQTRRGQCVYSVLKQDQRDVIKRNSGVHQFYSLKSI